MSNDSKTIARRMVRWASNYSPEIINRSCGYCMSGRWQDFYQKHLFPGKILDLQKLDDLVTCLHRRGLYEDAEDRDLTMNLNKRNGTNHVCNVTKEYTHRQPCKVGA